MKKNNFLFNQVAIMGVGLIGGSIGMAIKKKRIARRVVGFSRRQKTIKEALKLRAIDSGTLSLRKALKDSDLIILATPVNTIIKLSRSLVKIAEKKSIITDVGSCKSEIVSSFERILPKDIEFVGAHPLAGSERKGVNFGSPDMFENTLCILTPTHKTNKKAFNKIKKFWQSLGAQVKILNPSEHDRVLGFVSHLPHIVAFSLIQSIPEKYLKFAPLGLKDMTRIASSDPVVWSDIFFTNRKLLLEMIDRFVVFLRRFKKLIRSNNEVRLTQILFNIKNKRDKLI
jgi:prephenate dehydrogenase